MPVEENSWLNRYDTSADDHYSQAGDLFRLMNQSQQSQLAMNIAEGLVHATGSVQERILAQFAKADPDYAVQVSNAIALLK
jgi:catalase